MARQIAYDPVALRANLLSVFWAKGYAETSLTDLEAATGLNRRQLYNGPGDKRAMFVGALDDFSDRAGRDFLVALEGEGAGIAQIAALLRRFVSLAGEGGAVNGCLVCSASQEEIAADPIVRKRIDGYLDRIAAAYRNALTRGAARGEVALTPAQIDDKASALLGIHVALCILGRAGRAQSDLTRMAEDAINALR